MTPPPGRRQMMILDGQPEIPVEIFSPRRHLPE